MNSLSRPVQVWLTIVYPLRLNQGKQNGGNTRGVQAFFLDQDKPNQGRKQGKKLASKVKGKCSGKSDWLMAGRLSDRPRLR